MARRMQNTKKEKKILNWFEKKLEENDDEDNLLEDELEMVSRFLRELSKSNYQALN